MSMTREEWLKKAEATMKGAVFNDATALQGRIAGPTVSRPQHGPWRIFMELDHASAEQAQEDIAGGADGLVLVRPEYVTALNDLPLHKIALRNNAGDDGAIALRQLIESKPLDPARLDIDFDTTDEDFALSCLAAGFRGPVMRVDGRVGHGNGLNDAQELGAVLGVALYKFRKIEALSDDVLARSVSVTLSATQNTFNTIAKFRAMRVLWAALLKACKLHDAPLALHAETSRVMYADVNAHTNILRAVSATVGAGLGGASSISVLPFSQHQGTPNAFARRVARNVQNVLLQEANLWRVDDPAAGAGALERQTQRFCEEAWAIMQKAEAGDWPVALREEPACRPIIGVTKYKPTKNHAPEIEAGS
jgi:methylmalonyl-CoA mutase